MDWAAFHRVWGRADGAAVDAFAFIRGGEAGNGGLVDAGLIVEEDIDVIEAGAELVGKDLQLNVAFCHGYYVLFDHHEPFS